MSKTRTGDDRVKVTVLPDGVIMHGRMYRLELRCQNPATSLSNGAGPAKVASFRILRRVRGGKAIPTTDSVAGGTSNATSADGDSFELIAELSATIQNSVKSMRIFSLV